MMSKILISKEKLFLSLFCFYILAEFRFFYLIPLPNIFSGAASNKFLPSVIAFGIFVFYIICYIYEPIKKYKFTFWIMALFILLGINSVHMLLTYSYKLTSILWFFIPYLSLLLYFPLVRFLKNELVYAKFIYFCKISVLILCGLFLLQEFIFKNQASAFLELDGLLSEKYEFGLPKDEIFVRVYGVFDGFIRVFSIVIAFEIIHKRLKKCKLSILSLLLMIICIMVIDQSRYYLITILSSILVIFFIENGKKMSLKTILMIFIFFISFIPVIYKAVLSILNSIEAYNGSAYARVDAILYYLGLEWNKLFWGLGFVIPDELSPFHSLIKGPNLIYNYDDIGLIGTLASLGIFGLIGYILFILTVFSKWRKAYGKKTLIGGLFISLLLSSPIMSYLDSPRIICLLFTCVFIELELNKNYV
ncbi:hypothetical protein [Actinobacillus equuli]|uniref:hypothetical protein n=1 Tax=Actinobacillus equuli TaxID=718 RepID=UPI002441EF6C|nr:hypothetical protein [Actinobacillus equuli]WGE57045.1 hypothetical protein NYR71_10090 [Actinobacillus equuli subsp. equuli]